MGIKKIHVSNDLEETIVDLKKEIFANKDDRTMYIEGLLPETVYNLNISAKFSDGSWGPPYSLRVETSSDGKRRSVS